MVFDVDKMTIKFFKLWIWKAHAQQKNWIILFQIVSDYLLDYKYFKYFLRLSTIFAVTSKIKEPFENMIKYVSHAQKKLWL